MKLQKTLIVAALAAFAVPVAAQQVTFMTGPQGGSWIPLGGALKGMWEKAVPGLNITQTPGAGIANVRGVDEARRRSASPTRAPRSTGWRAGRRTRRRSPRFARWPTFIRSISR